MNNNPRALVIFSPAFPKDEADTLWLPWLQSLVKALNRNYPSLKIVIFSFQSPSSTSAYKWFGNLVIPFNGMQKKKLPRLLMWVNITKKLGEVKRTYDIIGIFSMWCNECAFVGKKAAALYGIQHRCWLLGGDARKSNKYVKKIHPKASELVAASDFLQQEFYKNHYVKPSHIIYHGLDRLLFTDVPADKDIDIIGVGNLCALKQYDVFVEIIAEIKKHIPSIKVMLCGDGEERVRLEKTIKERSLENNIEMSGMLQHPQVLKIMHRAKILLHPSCYEGFGTVCMEALYAGAHVVSFCRPLDAAIENWHIVRTKEEMIEKALSLLNTNSLQYKNVLVKDINDTAKEVMDLFD